MMPLMRRVVAGLLLPFMALAGGVASACHSVQHGFAEDMQARLATSMPDASVALAAEDSDPLVLKLSSAGEAQADINLHRLFGYCQENAIEACEMVKADYVTKIAKASLVTPPKATTDSLRLIVRDKAYLDHVLGLAKGQGADSLPVYRRIGSDLYALLAQDLPTAIAVVSQGQLAEMRVSAKKGWALASAQTAALLPEMPDGYRLQNQSYAFEGQDYLGSMLVDLGAWQAIADEAGPNLLMTVTADNFVFVGQLAEGPDFDAFRTAVEHDCEASPRCISPHIYRFREGRWQAVQ